MATLWVVVTPRDAEVYLDVAEVEALATGLDGVVCFASGMMRSERVGFEAMTAAGLGVHRDAPSSSGGASRGAR